MYIKKITISNFKSYGGKCVLEGISRNITAFVGSVGSGKSNFLEAIKFVSEFGYIELKDKMRLLNSNSRERVLAVELEFGECDLFNGKEISFKRKVKENRDMFYINQQMVSRKDFMAVLEVCAFCTKSLYFASPRTINDFVMTSAHGRLLSFIDCLGTSISLSLASINKTALKMEELKVKYEKLDDFLANMAAYNYDEELEKLQKYKELQAKKSYLILLLHNHYIRNWQQKIKQLEDMRGTEQTKKFYDLQVERNRLKIRLQDVHRSILNGGYLKEDMEKEMISLLVKKEKISLAMKEADQNIEYAKKSVQDETKVNELIEEISSLEQKINALEVKYSEKNQELVDLTESLSMAEQTRLELLTNIRRFQSKADRNRWINEQLRLIESKVVANEEGKSELLAQRAQLCRKRVDLERELQEHDTESESEQRCELKKKHYETVIHIKELRRNQNEIEENVKMLEETLDGKKVELRFKQGLGTYNGGESIQKVLNKWKNSGNEYYLNLLRGYHGMVIDNFVCSQQINIAVESAVGKMLYMHIIDDNTVGNGLLKEMKEMQLPGEVVFLPLNRIVPKQIHRRADDEVSQYSTLVVYHTLL
ncbi:hypothetical protein O3M35_000101 [Rhynocoris fuscipes]|uniref:RecF/RecN/SMC N-terminal domain-containing protein n=1 Tax=Rhynocoris fuscipes TaxID=488301 RepID=A0AAW1DLG5_9HEMI